MQMRLRPGAIPDHPRLLRELRLLERRTHRSGKDSVDHGRVGHDDSANCLCACAVLSARRGYPTDLSWVSDSGSADNAEQERAFLNARLENHIRVHSGYYLQRRWL
jgi:hypothetical protein